MVDGERFVLAEVDFQPVEPPGAVRGPVGHFGLRFGEHARGGIHPKITTGKLIE